MPFNQLQPTSSFRSLREVEMRRRITGEPETESYSLDGSVGGTYRDKPIWDLTQISDNLNRSGWSWNTPTNPGVLSTTDRTINFGFWNSQNDFFGTGYINDAEDTAFDEFFLFRNATATAPGGAFSAAQRIAARDTIVLWDDLINVNFVESSVATADIRYGNTSTGGAQAYAYLPFGNIFNDNVEGGFNNLEDLGGDVWVDYNVASNFSPLRTSYYSYTTLIHETGHALGLSHPGDYDALDDNDGIPGPDPITYENDAFYAQDSTQYTVMSYFDGYETGQQEIDWTLLNFVYASTPMVHDIAAIQAIYGADMTTRTGDTVYGFNSTADRDVYNFAINTRPILTIWDAGGNDTIDFSGWNTPSTINLNEGGFSSGGGVQEFQTLAQVNAARAALGFAPRTQATYDFYMSTFRDGLGLTDGLYRDNISIAYGVTIENARGGAGNDLIIANRAANRIDGGAGSDTVSYATADALAGGVTIVLGSDILGLGAAAGDRLVSIENIIGTVSDDVIVASSSENVLDGGAGSDTVSYEATNAQSGGVTIVMGADITGFGAAAGDRLISIENITGTVSNDVIIGSAGDNIIDGGAGGRDVMYGGRGVDTLSYNSATAAVTLNLQNGRTGGASSGDTYYEFENLRGSGFDDTLDGDSGSNKIWGGSGSDRIQGNNGNDDLYGEAGADIINGNSGDDRITGGAGADRLTGDQGNDVFVYLATETTVDVITDFTRGRDKIDLSAIDAIFGTPGNDAFAFIGSSAFSNIAGQVRYAGGFVYADVNGDSVADLTIQLTGAPVLTVADFVL